MPEGHVVHRLAAEHAGLLTGTPLRTSSPQGRFAAGAARLDGACLTGTDAHGKHLFHEYATPAGERLWLHVHLGLYGKFAAGDSPTPPATGQVRLRWQTPLAYLDLRGPAACELVDDGEKSAIHDRLGVDPLRDAPPDGAPHGARPGALCGDPRGDLADGTGERSQVGQALTARVLASRAPIARLLLDQSVIAGVGVAYRAEVLFRHGIDPMLPGRSLARTSWLVLWDDLVGLMREGVRTARIDTVRPEHTPEAMGRPAREDRHGGEVYVYRRAGQPCLVCTTPVRVAVLAGRNLYWCPRCQRH